MEKLIKILSKEVGDAFEKCGYESSLGSTTVSDRPDLCQAAASRIFLLPVPDLSI